MIAIIPFEPIHRAMLAVRREQEGEPERFEQLADRVAAQGPAFSVVEQDEDGNIKAVLACAGLAENSPTYATAWAAFAEGLRTPQWATIIRAIRAVLDGATYRRIDLLARANWAEARRFAEALGFREDFIMYARVGGGEE